MIPCGVGTVVLCEEGGELGYGCLFVLSQTTPTHLSYSVNDKIDVERVD